MVYLELVNNYFRISKQILQKFRFYCQTLIFYYYLLIKSNNLCNIIYRQGIVTGLQEIDKLKSQVKDVHVPLEVFE